MMSKIFASLLFIVIMIQIGRAQSSFIPKSVGSPINSTYDEISPVISPDGKVLFFTRINHPENNQTAKNTASIWCAERLSEGWTAPKLMDFLNKGKFNTVLSITEDGKKLLVSNDNILAVSNKEGDRWSDPVIIDVKATRDASLSSDGKYLIFVKGGKLYICEYKEGSWSEPLEIKGLAAGKMSMPHLTQNNKTLYYIGNRKGYRQDVYRIERIGEGWDTWSTPVPLSDLINTPSTESRLHTNPNGSWGYYSSTRNPVGKADIYQVKLYEDNPYVLATGKIINAVTKRPLTNKEATILVNGQPSDAFTLNKDSGTYTVRLPFGKKYSISANVPNYRTTVIQIDATADDEFRKVLHDIEQEPLPYVLLKGKMLVKNTGKIIPESAHPRILVDGEEIDSALIDKTTGTYAVKLNHGSLYYVQVTAKRFDSLPEIVDLTNVDGFEEITLDLQADAEKMAIITGSIIDKKSGKRLSDLSAVRLVVEGVSSVVVNINEVTDQYELRVPLREKHTISAYLPGYCSVYETIDVSGETKEIKIHRDLTVVPFERGQSVRLNNVSFEPGKTILNEASYAELDRLVAFLNTYPDVKIEIGGHTDKSSKISTLNMAKEVANYLFNKGIAKNRVVARGYASTKPIASNASAEGRSLNRRIEFTILEK